MSKYWIETVWEIPKDEVEDFAVILAEWGCLGSFEDLPLQENAQGSTSFLKAYFPDQDLESFKTKLSECRGEPLCSPCLGQAQGPAPTKKNSELARTPMGDVFQQIPALKMIRRIPQENWATEWKKYFKPFFLTNNIVICPSWEIYEKKGGEKVVILDPGMAFGTGQHDTTRFCAEFICELKTENPHLKSFLDVGCGSGILSLIAKKIGFETVVGIDTDPVAIETARENLTRNLDCKEIDFADQHVIANPAKRDEAIQKLDRHVGLWPPRDDNYDVIVANIIAETLCDLKNDLIPALAPNGFLILSGILPDKESLIKNHFDSLEFVREKKSVDWHAYLYRQK